MLVRCFYCSGHRSRITHYLQLGMLRQEHDQAGTDGGVFIYEQQADRFC